MFFFVCYSETGLLQGKDMPKRKMYPLHAHIHEKHLGFIPNSILNTNPNSVIFTCDMATSQESVNTKLLHIPATSRINSNSRYLGAPQAKRLKHRNNISLNARESRMVESLNTYDKQKMKIMY